MSVSIGISYTSDKCSHGYVGQKVNRLVSFIEAYDSEGDNDCLHSSEINDQVQAIYLGYAERPL